MYSSKANKYFFLIMCGLYGVTLFTCLISDIALHGTITWFYILLVSILILFSITNLPFMLRKHKGDITAFVVTVLTYLLLYVCCVYVKGDWLLSFAYPITSYSFVFAWSLFLLFRIKTMNGGFKSALAFFLLSVFIITCNPLVLMLSGDEFKFVDLFIYSGGAVDYSANGIIFYCLIACALLSACIGCMKLMRSRHKRHI